MALGYCVDCNYEGELNGNGDCLRCGSDWTVGNSQVTDLSQFEDLDKMNVGGRITNTGTLEIASFA